MRITVNGCEVDPGDSEAISYERVVELADTGRNAVHSVKYTGGGAPKPEGILMPGTSVTLADGMSFSAYVTDNA